MPVVPLLGPFRSGTNFARTLLEQHFHVRVSYSHYGWKHGLLPSHADASATPPQAPLVLVKHPLATVESWLNYHQSVGRNLRTEAQDLASFLRQRITYFCEGANVAPQYRFSNPLQMWNCVVWNHVQFARQHGGLVMRYEDLLADPQQACHYIAQHFQLQSSEAGEGIITAPTQVVRRMGDGKRSKPRDYLTREAFEKAAYFLQGEFLAHYSADDLAFAAQELDTELLDLLGYRPQHAAVLAMACRLPSQA